MIKKILIIIFIFLSSLSFSEKLLLASFNTARLGESEKDYVAFSKIISKFDIIAMQEVMDESALMHLKQKYLNNYDYVISQKVGTKKYKEQYAIFYNKNKVDEVNLIAKYDDKYDDFIREPSAFYIKSKNMKFIAILAHSIFSDNEKKRAVEASKYIDVYKYFKDKNKDVEIILLGDFNLNGDDRAFDNLKKEYNLVNLIKDNQKTTISKTGLANSYDNIFFNNDKFKYFTKRYGIYDYTKNNNEKIRKYISDHLLIFMELDNER